MYLGYLDSSVVSQLALNISDMHLCMELFMSRRWKPYRTKQAESCCIYVKPKTYATYVWHNSIVVWLFFKWAILGLFFFILTVHVILLKFRPWLDSNYGPLVSEATALPAKPQPLPILFDYSAGSSPSTKVPHGLWE